MIRQKYRSRRDAFYTARQLRWMKNNTTFSTANLAFLFKMTRENAIQILRGKCWDEDKYKGKFN